MKQIASNIAFGILILLFACAKEPDEIPKTATPVAVNLSLRTDAQRPVSRATDENAVRDVNIYFINKHTETSYHTYAAGATIHTTLPPGDYTVYAVANAGRDMGERSRESLPSLVKGKSVRREGPAYCCAMKASRRLTAAADASSPG